MEMSEIPEPAAKLLVALIDIEDRAIEAAREGGCTCSSPVPDDDRTYPIAVFSRQGVIGKPLDKIEWRMQHEDGCPMDGQEGVG
jgi:hypothetical protein